MDIFSIWQHQLHTNIEGRDWVNGQGEDKRQGNLCRDH